MPWKHSSQLSYSPAFWIRINFNRLPEEIKAVIRIRSKDPPLQADLLSCYAPTRGTVLFQLFVLTLGYPIAYQLGFIMRRTSWKFKLMLVVFCKMCLNSSVQKHSEEVVPSYKGTLPKKLQVDLTI